MDKELFINNLKELKLTSGTILTRKDNQEYFSLEYCLKTFGNKYSIKTNVITDKMKAKIALNIYNLNKLRQISHDLRSVLGIINNGRYLFNSCDAVKNIKDGGEKEINQEINDYDALVKNGQEELEKVINNIETAKSNVSGTEISIYYMLEDFFPNYLSTLILDDSLKIKINFNLELFNKIEAVINSSSANIACRIIEKKYLEIVDISHKKILQRFRLE